MALSEREIRALKQDLQRIEKDIRDKEEILAYYRCEPSMQRHIPGMENQITGLKRERQHVQTAIQRG